MINNQLKCKCKSNMKCRKEGIVYHSNKFQLGKLAHIWLGKHFLIHNNLEDMIGNLLK
jgi:hypothetical protein